MLEDIAHKNLSAAEAADEERVAKIGAANAYAAGADTVSTLPLRDPAPLTQPP